MLHCKCVSRMQIPKFLATSMVSVSTLGVGGIILATDDGVKGQDR